jgi:HAD superfamily hydrolase (TIGR01509 family)
VIAAVVFDLDGVLLDSEPVWETVRRSYVLAHGGRWSDEIQSNSMGMSTAEWARYLSEQLPGDVSPDDVASEVIACMHDEYTRQLPMIEGARDVVTQLSDKWPLGLASSSPRALIDDVLALAALADSFAAVVSADEVARGKPAPDVYVAVCERLGVRPTDCVAVEDSSNGLRAAHAAGAYVVAVPNQAFPPAHDAVAHASLVLDDIRELTVDAISRLGAPPAPR